MELALTPMRGLKILVYISLLTQTLISLSPKENEREGKTNCRARIWAIRSLDSLYIVKVLYKMTFWTYRMCIRTINPYYTVTYYMKWVKTVWTVCDIFSKSYIFQYCLSKKQLPILNAQLLNKMSNYFWNMLYYSKNKII